MNIAGTGFQVWPLTTGNNDDPSLTLGKPTSFNCNTVPDRCPTGPLAYYLPGIIVTFSGQIVQAGGTGQIVYQDRLCGALFDSFDWIQCWHGNQVSANHVKGADWFPIEYNAMGFRHPLRIRNFVAAAGNGTYPFEISVFVPACSGFGRLFLETMQLSTLFRNSQLKINVAALSVLQNFSPGATFTNLTARASAVLVPRQELVLGPAVEWILTQIVAGSNSPQVQIKNFGTDTQMQGVEPGGGVISLMELCLVGDQGGAFTADTITQYQFPWRGQQVTQHPQAIMAQVIGGMPNDRNHAFNTTPTGGISDFTGYPYAQNNTGAMPANPNQDLTGAYAWIMAQGADQLELTDLQTADSDQSYFLTSSSPFGATHMVLGQYARSWQASMVQNWVQQITAGGAGSLAAYVLGASGLASAQLHRRTPKARHITSQDQARYLAYQFAPAPVAGKLAGSPAGR
jgi:hypothetical protein